jgi:sigma-B regulation protein RsbU (phosphoserine phosphatase)
VDTSLSASRLEALLESAQLLHSSLDTEELTKHLLRSVMGRLVVARGFVALQQEDGTHRLALVRGFKGLAAGEAFDEARARAAGAHLVFPIGDAEQPLGLVGIGTPASGSIDAGEQDFLRALSSVAASGIANARAHDQVQRLNRRLDGKVHELKTLLELVKALTEVDEPDEVAHLLGLTLAGQWAVGRFAVAASKPGHPPVVRQKGTSLAWSAEWVPVLRDLSEAVVVDGLPAGPLRDAMQSQRLAVVFPLRSAAETFGFAALGARPGQRSFSEADLELGAGLAAQSVVAFENAWHLREVLEKKQMERELAVAASIQQNLFPAAMPSLDGFEVAALNRPARQVGGDYYDALTADAADRSGSWLFCVADVSGKGVAASLLMSNIQATLRALLGREASLSELARVTNDLMFTSTPGNRYVTAILLSVEPASGHCRYVNGGHTEGLVLRTGGEIDYLPATGMALGMFPGVSYEEKEFELAPGDLLALYSDGVTEALNLDDEEFGVERLIDSLRRTEGEAPCEMVDSVLRDVDRFAGLAPQYDDITLLLLKRRAG